VTFDVFELLHAFSRTLHSAASTIRVFLHSFTSETAVTRTRLHQLPPWLL